MLRRAGVERPRPRVRGVRRVRRHLRRLLRRRAACGAAGAARPARRGPPLRPAHHVRGGRQGHREGDRVPGPGAARRATAPAPSRAPSRRPAPQCNGRGEVRSVRQTMLGQMVNVSRLPALPGRGPDRRDAVRDVPRRRPHRAKATLRVTIPPGIDEGHQIRLSNEGEVGPRGGPPGSLYVAVHVAPHPTLERDGTELYYEATGLDRPGGARHADHGPDGRGRRGGRDQARHAARHRDPAARQGRAAPAPGRARAATCTCWSTSSCRPSSTKRQRELLPSYAAEAGEMVHGGRRLAREARRCAASAATDAARRRLRSSSRSRPTSRPSRRSARSWACGAGRVVRGARIRAGRRGPRGAGRPDAAGRSSGPTFRRATPRLPRPTAAEVDDALGHLQAFGLRPIGELRTRIVHEADWADAWKAHFPVMRIGRRLVIRPTWRRHRAQPGDVVLALDPGMAFGTGLHPTTRLCLAASRRVADRGDARRGRVLDVGCGSGDPRDRGGPARGGPRRRRRHRPDRGRGDDRERAAQPARAPGPRPGRQPAERRARLRCRPREPHRGRAGAAGHRRSATSSGPAGPARVGRSSSTARPRSRAAFEAAGLEVDERARAKGDWVALEARRPA